MADDADDDDFKHKAPIDQYDGVELPALSVGADGMPNAGLVGQAPAIPAATPDTFVCLRGPCKHYWELVTFMASGNPAETWGEDGLKDDDGNPIRMPRQINRTCLAHPGTETELTEDTVYACSRWDPLSRREVHALEKRRNKYLKLYPQHVKEI